MHTYTFITHISHSSIVVGVEEILGA
eukprot:COSAG01_NODE_61610_length_288_cov_1.730159_1_plen_25_part_01